MFFPIICFSQNQVGLNFISDIEKNQYPIFNYRGYNYMIENLKVTRFLNGDKIIESKSAKEWKINCSKAIPTYMVNQKFPQLGYIYNGYAVYDSRGLLPKGYSIPADSIYYDEYWKGVYKGNEKNREEFEKKLLGNLYSSSSACNFTYTDKSIAFYVEPNGKLNECPCRGGRWWMEEMEPFKHIDNSFSTACQTGKDGTFFDDFPKSDWQSYGFYVRGIKKN